MNAESAGGLAAALGAALLYGSAPIAQAVAARRIHGGGLGLTLTLRLARQPLWLFGLGCETGGFVLEAFALSLAPTTLIAPILACELLVFVFLAWPVFGERPSKRGGVGALVTASALTLLALAFTGSAELGSAAHAVTLLAFLGSCVVVTGLAAFLGGRALRAQHRTLSAGIFATASGVAYGFATMATRQVGRTFVPSRLWDLFATPTPYVLVGCSVLGIAMMQRGLQISPSFTFPVTSAVSALLPVLLGAMLLGDEVPTGARMAAFDIALALLAGGVALIGKDRSGAQRASARQPAE